MAFFTVVEIVTLDINIFEAHFLLPSPVMFLFQTIALNFWKTSVQDGPSKVSSTNLIENTVKTCV